MEVTGSYPCATRPEDGSWATLFDAYLRLRGQALRQETCKNGRHVLNDNDGDGQVTWEAWDEAGKRIGSACGDTDGNNVDPFFVPRQGQARWELLGSKAYDQRGGG